MIKICSMNGLVYFPKVPFFNHKVSIGLYHIKGYWRIHQNLIKRNSLDAGVWGLRISCSNLKAGNPPFYSTGVLRTSFSLRIIIALHK